MFPLRGLPSAVKLSETESRRGARGWGRGSGCCLMGKESQFGKTESSRDGGGDGCTAVRTHLMPLYI